MLSFLLRFFPIFLIGPPVFIAPFARPCNILLSTLHFLIFLSLRQSKSIRIFLAPFSCYSFPGNTLFANSLLCLILYSQILPFYVSLYLRTNGPGLSNFIAFRWWNFSGSYEKQPFLYFARYGFPSYRNRWLLFRIFLSNWMNTFPSLLKNHFKNQLLNKLNNSTVYFISLALDSKLWNPLFALCFFPFKPFCLSRTIVAVKNRRRFFFLSFSNPKQRDSFPFYRIPFTSEYPYHTETL